MKEDKMHYVIPKGDGFLYVCNQAVGITESKSTLNKQAVTCQNCLRKLGQKVNRFPKKPKPSFFRRLKKLITGGD